MPLTHYLQSRYRKTTARRYAAYITAYLDAHPQAATASYADIMNYIAHLRKQYPCGRTIQQHLQAIKQYYHYLNHTNQRADHPCRYITLRDVKKPPIQLQDLFSPQELEKLLDRETLPGYETLQKPQYRKTQPKNKLIISLLIHQGLTVSDLVQLKCHHINLPEGSITIPAGTWTNPRTLTLQPKQIMQMHHYLTQTRPALLVISKPPLKTNTLLITAKGTKENSESIQYLIKTLQPLYPDRKLTPRTIRQSVITNLLKQGHDLRYVQHFAGHKQPSTTERYRQSQVEELKAQILKHHPLDYEAKAN